MAEGVGFPFPSLPLNEGRTYGQPEVVLIIPSAGLSARPAPAAGGTLAQRAFRQLHSC